MSKEKKKRAVSRRTHKVWQLQEAKARFSELVNEVQRDGYHTITRNGQPVVVVVSKEEFEKMAVPQNTLLELFLSAPLPEVDLDIRRSKETGRDIDL